MSNSNNPPALRRRNGKSGSIMAQVLGKKPYKPYFKVWPDETGYRVSFSNLKLRDSIYDWFKGRGYEPSSLKLTGWEYRGIDRDTAMLAKLTWGGANNDSEPPQVL